MPQTILLVDDEPNIRELAKLYFEREGFTTRQAGSGNAAMQALRSNPPDLMVLDLMLPELDGSEICRRIRAGQVTGVPADLPILMLTARSDDVDKIVGLELGADDYLTKPFNPRELVARAKAILRRTQTNTPSTNTTQNGGTVQIGALQIAPAQREAHLNKQLLDLRAKEFDLLLTFARHKGLVLTREQLLELVWGFAFYGQTRTVDVHVAQLRKALSSSSIQIETVTGIGYKLVCNE